MIFVPGPALLLKEILKGNELLFVFIMGACISPYLRSFLGSINLLPT